MRGFLGLGRRPMAFVAMGVAPAALSAPGATIQATLQPYRTVSEVAMSSQDLSSSVHERG